jgi:hypothetical protein
MRRFLYILGAILAYFVFCSKSCTSEEKDNSLRQETELAQTKKNIKEEFESEKLSRKSLRAFEVKAEQKLVDLADYLHIYDDESMDDSFKKQARQMILDLFLPDNVMINLNLSGEKDQKRFTVAEFLNKDQTSGYHSRDYIFDSIEIARPLRSTDETDYRGSLVFSCRMIAYSSSDTVRMGPVKMEADIIAAKVKKPFGTDTLSVWGVFLGNIK